MVGQSLQRIIWLASFPKSGNTWTRIVLANLLMPPDQVPDINHLYRFTTADIRQDFFDRAAGGTFKGGTVDQWLAIRPKALALIAASKQGHHFVKTHSQIKRMKGAPLIPPELTAGAVYLMRNPFDVALSYARHLSIPIDDTIHRMLDANAINASPAGVMEVIGRWDDHVRSWAEAPGLGAHVMRYEDMLADPEPTFRKLLDYLGIRVGDGKLRKAMRAASFKNLQTQEALKGFRERPEGMEKFFASGTSGGWREKMSADQIARLREQYAAVLERYYPELLDETAGAA